MSFTFANKVFSQAERHPLSEERFTKSCQFLTEANPTPPEDEKSLALIRDVYQVRASKESFVRI